MLSVLLPVYNFDIRPLVAELDEQCRRSGKVYEILCFDDASEPEYHRLNSKVVQLEGVQYHRFEENIGRAAIRNRLAEGAKYEYLLFLDCDSKVIKDNFIADYLQSASADQVLCGGREYEEEPPEDLKYYFHWKYGTRREVRSARERNKKPHSGFMSNNFLVPKKIMLKIPFDDSLKQYGHEDTLWGQELQQSNIQIHHIENPILHIGLDATPHFINKTQAALKNLVQLQDAGKAIHIKINSIAKLTRIFGLNRLSRLVGNGVMRRMEENFSSSRPSLNLFDIYRLIYLSRLK